MTGSIKMKASMGGLGDCFHARHLDNIHRHEDTGDTEAELSYQAAVDAEWPTAIKR